MCVSEESLVNVLLPYGHAPHIHSVHKVSRVPRRLKDSTHKTRFNGVARVDVPCFLFNINITKGRAVA